jgi:ATP-dependent DNA helicase RecG
VRRVRRPDSSGTDEVVLARATSDGRWSFGGLPSLKPLVDLLRRAEGKTLEFKRDLCSPDKVLRTLVAFANGAGGTLVVGVTDGKREVVGLADPRLDEERLANLACSRVEPPLSPGISVVSWRRTHVLVVEVQPGTGRPYRLKRAGFPEGVFVRIGSTNRTADPAQIEELRRVVLRRTFDEEALADTNSEAIDFRAASGLFGKEGRTLASADVATLGLVAKEGGKTVATVGGVLTFGRDRPKHFPEAYLKAGCFAGVDRSRIADSADSKSHLPLLADDGLKFMQRHLRQAIHMATRRSAHSAGQIWTRTPLGQQL